MLSTIIYNTIIMIIIYKQVLQCILILLMSTQLAGAQSTDGFYPAPDKFKWRRVPKDISRQSGNGSSVGS